MKRKFLFAMFFIFFINLIISTYVLANEPIIYSPAAVLIDANNGQILYAKNADSLMYPASTTKILTAIIALESCSLDTKATASKNAILSIKSGYTNANIQVGETLTMEDLLYALMLNSANEAANVIAEHIGGSIENFANIMNAKAIELGCINSHFVNANGVHADNHYTTASDLAKIAKYCMQNETFRKIVSTKTYTLPSTPQYPQSDRILRNSNSLLIENNKFYYPYATGVKSGFTSQAKNCLVSSSSKDGLDLISVVLHAETTEDGRSARYVDSTSLLEYGNNNYNYHSIIKKGDIIDSLTINNATTDTQKLNIIAKNDISITLRKSEQANISPAEISLNSDISAPIEAGSVLGTITYNINGNTYSSDLIAESNVDFFANVNTSTTTNLYSIIKVISVIILLWIIRRFFKKYVIIYRSTKLRKRTKKYLEYYHK